MTNEEREAALFACVPQEAWDALARLRSDGRADDAAAIESWFGRALRAARNQGLDEFAQATGTCACGDVACPSIRYATVARLMKEHV